MHFVRRNSFRRPVIEGDVFDIQVYDFGVVFGRVAMVSQRFCGFSNVLMLYIFDPRIDSLAGRPACDPRHLLIPPQFSDRGCWTKGFFRTVEHRAIQPHELLSQHCFELPAFKTVIPKPLYYDENGNLLAHRYEPCGIAGFSPAGAIESKVVEALAG